MLRKLFFVLEIRTCRGTSNFLSPISVPVNPQFRISQANASPSPATLSTFRMNHTSKPRQTIPALEKATVPEILSGIESYLGTRFLDDPVLPKPSPLVVVISGPSGVGKDAVINKLREERADLHTVVTVTSRAIRPGEVDGVDYIFVSKEEFLAMDEKDELLESALVYGHYKGIPKKQIKECLAKGKDVVVRVDVQGAATLRSIFGNSAVFVFLAAESQMKLVERLIDRKTESIDDLLVRIATSLEEMKFVDSFDYVVVNAEGKLDDAVRLLGSIIDAQKARVFPGKVAV